MSLSRGLEWNYQDLQFRGYSVAGITTTMLFRNANLCFDVGQGLPFQVPAKRVCITHAHSDHASGIHYLLSQRAMQGHHGTEIFLPEPMVDPIQRILGIWSELEDFRYEYTIVPALPGERYELDKHFVMKPFRTIHRVPSQGYLVYRKRKQLRADLRGKTSDAIESARVRGEDLNEYIEEPIVAFTGDTMIDFLASDPDIKRTKILFMECTFWDEKRPVSAAREWGHIHLDEILEILPILENERVVLIHTSARYSTPYLHELLAKRLPPEWLDRVLVYPRDL